MLSRAFLLACLALTACCGSTTASRPCAVEADCDDSLACTEDACRASACVNAPNHAACGTGQLCVAGRGCVAGSACATDADCDDGWICNGLERCAGVCGAGALPVCDDGVLCTVDACDLPSNRCTHAPDDARCDDGSLCTGIESCSADGCRAGSPPTCDDGDPCTRDYCSEPVAGCVSFAWDEDEDGYPARWSPAGDACSGTDCDDFDPLVHPGAPDLCATLRDEDCDGDVGCFDAECWGVGLCPVGGCSTGDLCTPARSTSCSTFGAKLLAVATDGPDSSNVSSCWCGLAGYDGPEVVYRISPGGGTNLVEPEDSYYVFHLQDATVDLDVFVLRRGSDGACDPSACLDVSATEGTGNEHVQWGLLEDVFVVIAGRNGVTGSAETRCGVQSNL